MSRIRQTEIHARRVRRKKLRHLRQKHAAARTGLQKEAVLTKAARIAPWLAEEQFLRVVKGK